MIEKYKAPPVINSFKNAAEEFVRNWYLNVEKRPKVQARETQEKFGYAPPAPPCIALEEEK